MEDIQYIDNVQQAKALFKPLRMEILKELARPQTCHELAAVFTESPQNIYYHVKILERAGLVQKVKEQRVRGVMQGIYQAAAQSYWLSPEMAGRLGGSQKATDQMSFAYLLKLAEQMHRDVGSLTKEQDETPSLGISAQIELPDAETRAAFMQELQLSLQNLAEKYGVVNEGTSPIENTEVFDLMVACYPHPDA